MTEKVLDDWFDVKAEEYDLIENRRGGTALTRDINVTAIMESLNIL